MRFPSQPADPAHPQTAGPGAPGTGAWLRRWGALVLLCLWAAAALVYPPITKYDLYDPGLGGREGDVGLYVRMYEGVPLHGIARPWRYRVLTPYMARLVPDVPQPLARYFDLSAEKRVKFRFGMVNMLGLACSGLLLIRLGEALGLASYEALLAAFLFFTSFPVVNFGGTPMVDAWAYAFLLLGMIAALRGSIAGVVAATLVGLFAKETTVLVAAVILLLPHPPRRKASLLLAMVPGLLAYGIFRWGYYAGGYGQPDDPISTFRTLAEHFRSGPYLAWIAWDGGTAFGLLWPLVFVGWWGLRRTPDAPLARLAWMVPLVLVMPFLIGSNIGRIWFYAFPAVIPLALVGLRRFTGGAPALPAR
jgi:hypothetical protein